MRRSIGLKLVSGPVLLSESPSFFVSIVFKLCALMAGAEFINLKDGFRGDIPHLLANELAPVSLDTILSNETEKE